ncbi:MAG TPA: ADP-ribosylglycohydrolase family protein [Kofleriaceae bacterium]|nr:ADP-ribosylglycohydrolase family protein [Kofleriaceae bacterium]
MPNEPSSGAKRDGSDGRAEADRARGALLGLAVGDALGTTYEFARMTQPPYPALATGPATDVVGGGPFELVAGQVTDDTQLAVCLARSLAERGGLDTADVAARYVAWSAHAFDIGAQTQAAIERLEGGDVAPSAALGVWREYGRRPAGNGSLMRTAPIAVALRGAVAPLRGASETALIDAAIADSLITHADPRCALACAAFDAAIAAAITAPDAGGAPAGGGPAGGAPVGGGALIAAARRALERGAARLREAWAGGGAEGAADREHLARAEADLAGDLDAALRADPDVYGEELHVDRTAGFVRVALRLAFWHAAHTPAWRDALIDVASRGGDADTNAAITGALLGARDGAAAIPPAWIERVLGATQPGPADWAEAHHPRHLLALVR